jgi:23S rRNA (guanosine2251-2'-O)-methyltransferase
MPEVIVIAHNIRSTHNVGSIFRTCDGFGVHTLILSGYTPYPPLDDDNRLPHIRHKISAQIHKTALGAETSVAFEYHEHPPLQALKNAGYVIVGLEQDGRAIDLKDIATSPRIALLIGEEVNGIAADLRSHCDVLVEIPMHGKKESFNVSVATGIALYRLTSLT